MRFLGILLLAACAWGQTDGITTSVFRTVVIPADEARFTVQVTVTSTTTVEQVVQALSGIGLQASDLISQSLSNSTTGVSFPQTTALSSVLTFSMTRPADSYNTLATKLEGLRRSPPAGYVVQYSATQGASAIAVEAMRRTMLPNLLADARAKGLTMANAGNLTLGAIRSISDTSDSSSGAIVGDLYYSASNFRVTYSLTVRFSVQ